MAYATTDDVEEALGRSLTDAETGQATGWLEDAAYLIDGWTGVAVSAATTDLYKRVSVNMVVRALNAGSTAGVDSTQEQTGPFAVMRRFTADASSGGVWLSATDKLMLRRVRSGGGLVSVALGSERYCQPDVDES